MKVSPKLLEMLVANHFQEVAPLDDSITSILIENAALITFPEKERVITHGSICEHFFFVISGSIRVQLLTNRGREVTLYHVHYGEVCALMLSCMLSEEPYPAEAIAESGVIALTLPVSDFDHAMQESHTFRHLVRKKFAKRLANVIACMGQVCDASKGDSHAT